ncbi:MAG: mevalonate kinase family protein [Chitinophagales bacterium]
MRFPAKILLFGEYTLIRGSQGLAIPFDRFSCELVMASNDVLQDSKLILDKIYQHICSDKQLSLILDTERFHQDIVKGLQIKMDIPVGYGLGSSGALTACVYERYAKKKATDINQLQTTLGNIESVFHGKSSGLDPLVSFLQKAIWIDAEKQNNEIQLRTDFKEEFSLFLIDTRQARRTEPLVNSFLEKCKNEKYESAIESEIVPLNNQLITSFIEGDWGNISSVFKQLSIKQLTLFKEQILPKHISIWQEGIATDNYYLKICGAGGGGFMLGITQDKTKVLATFNETNIIWI